MAHPIIWYSFILLPFSPSNIRISHSILSKNKRIIASCCSLSTFPKFPPILLNGAQSLQREVLPRKRREKKGLGTGAGLPGRKVNYLRVFEVEKL